MIERKRQETTITEEEAELYDRQIRLWGLDSQKRLRQARVLLFGLSSLGCEVAKNVILAGVKSLTLMDNVTVTQTDVVTNFTLTDSDVAKNRALSAMPNIQKLNPMVVVTSITENIDGKDEKFFEQYDVVCILGCKQSTAKKVNEFCNSQQIYFISGDCFGFYGFAFFDFGCHEFSEEVQQKPKKEEKTNDEPETKRQKIEHTESETTTVKRTVKFNRLSQALDAKDTAKRSPGIFDLMKIVWHFKDTNNCLPEADMSKDLQESLNSILADVDESQLSKPNLCLDNILSHTSGDFAPSCAIIGGIIGQEVIKAVSHKDAPLNNIFMFNGMEGSGYVQQLGD